MTYRHLLLVICVVCMWSHEGLAQERRIRLGDRLTITVLGRDDLTRTAVVHQDGSLQYPFLSSDPVAGFTLDQLRTILLIQLTRSLGSPPQAVDVLWAEDVGGDGEQIELSVLGQVRLPGVLLTKAEGGIQGALQAAGGLLPGARQSDIKLHRTTVNGIVAIPVDLERFLESGDISYLPALLNGDVLVVPGGTLSTAVRVLGAVTTPGLYQISAGATVFDLILQAGGLTDHAKTDKIRLVRPGVDVSAEYSVNIAEFLKTGQKPSTPPVEAGDLIVVPKRLVTYAGVVGVVRDVSIVLSVASFFLLLSR